jgi:hypothetical protein
MAPPHSTPISIRLMLGGGVGGTNSYVQTVNLPNPTENLPKVKSDNCRLPFIWVPEEEPNLMKGKQVAQPRPSASRLSDPAVCRL